MLLEDEGKRIIINPRAQRRLFSSGAKERKKERVNYFLHERN